LSAWDDLLDEFRALGGTADNIRLGHGEFGRGLFPVDPAKPVVIDIPENLLVATADMILGNGAPRVGPGAKTGEREKAWLNRYQEDVAWGNGEAGGIRQMFDMAAALPGDLRHQLLTEHQCGTWFQEPTEQMILQRYFESRHIPYKGNDVVMPLIELINHGDGESYQSTDTVRFTGTFPGEIFAKYWDGDALGFFQTWGIVTPRPLAFSVLLSGNIQSTPLLVQRNYVGPAHSELDWIPKMERRPGRVTLPFVMIGNERFPRLAKGIFYRLMRSAGFSGFEERFDLIQHANRLHFLNLLKAVEKIDLPMARMLQTMAHCQLRAMSFCVGVREIGAPQNFT
jgi:hypothetical protein